MTSLDFAHFLMKDLSFIPPDPIDKSKKIPDLTDLIADFAREHYYLTLHNTTRLRCVRDIFAHEFPNDLRGRTVLRMAGT